MTVSKNMRDSLLFNVLQIESLRFEELQMINTPNPGTLPVRVLRQEVTSFPAWCLLARKDDPEDNTHLKGRVLYGKRDTYKFSFFRPAPQAAGQGGVL